MAKLKQEKRGKWGRRGADQKYFFKFYVDSDTTNAKAAVPFESNGILTVDASTSGLLKIEASTIGQGYQATKTGDYLIYFNFQVNISLIE